MVQCCWCHSWLCPWPDYPCRQISGAFQPIPKLLKVFLLIIWTLTYKDPHFMPLYTFKQLLIIELRATHHMTGKSHYFNCFYYSGQNEKTRLFLLTPLFHCIMFCINPIYLLILLCNNNLAQSLNCPITLSPHHCILHNLTTGKKIGGRIVPLGLYLISHHCSSLQECHFIPRKSYYLVCSAW